MIRTGEKQFEKALDSIFVKKRSTIIFLRDEH